LQECGDCINSFILFIPTYTKELAIAILYFPTVVFWSSGVFKDPICIAGIDLLPIHCIKSSIQKKIF
jgi:hypothetical protein